MGKGRKRVSLRMEPELIEMLDVYGELKGKDFAKSVRDILYLGFKALGMDIDPDLIEEIGRDENGRFAKDLSRH